jgi:hypothetical protein
MSKEEVSSELSPAADSELSSPQSLDGGRRKRRNGSRKNSWLAHVKATMKVNRNKSFKQVLKLAKKTYKKSQSRSKSQSQSQSSSQSQSGGKQGVKRGGNSMNQSADSLLQKQQGGSGMSGKPAFGSSASPVA